MSPEEHIRFWFRKWEEGDFHNLNIADSFIHESPYGIIEGKANYLNIVEANQDKFLDHTFEIHDILEDETKACVRYTAQKPDFNLEVTEWHFIENDRISRIVSYYNIEGEISEDRVVEGY